MTVVIINNDNVDNGNNSIIGLQLTHFSYPSPENRYLHAKH